MHELSVMAMLIERLIEKAEELKAKRIIEVELLVGRLTMLGPEALVSVYEALSKGTILEGSRLLVKTVDPLVRCGSCGYEGGIEVDGSLHIPIPILSCPRCGSYMDVIKGRECQIGRVRIEL